MAIILLSMGAIALFLIAFVTGGLLGARAMRRVDLAALDSMNCTPAEAGTIGRAKWAIRSAEFR